MTLSALFFVACSDSSSGGGDDTQPVTFTAVKIQVDTTTLAPDEEATLTPVLYKENASVTLSDVTYTWSVIKVDNKEIAAASAYKNYITFTPTALRATVKNISQDTSSDHILTIQVVATGTITTSASVAITIQKKDAPPTPVTLSAATITLSPNETNIAANGSLELQAAVSGRGDGYTAQKVSYAWSIIAVDETETTTNESDYATLTQDTADTAKATLHATSTDTETFHTITIQVVATYDGDANITAVSEPTVITIAQYIAPKSAEVTVAFLNDTSDLALHYDAETHTFTAIVPDKTDTYQFAWYFDKVAQSSATEAFTPEAALLTRGRHEVIVTATETSTNVPYSATYVILIEE